MSDLLDYRDKKFTDLMRREDVEQLRTDAKSIEREVAGLVAEKKSLESRISALQDSQRRLVRFLDVISDK